MTHIQWQGIYIIPLHAELMDYCHAPTPYLIGVHSTIYSRLLAELGGTIVDDNISILDIDHKTFYSSTKQDDYGKGIPYYTLMSNSTLKIQFHEK